MSEKVDIESLTINHLCRSETVRRNYLDKTEADDFLIKSHKNIHKALITLVQNGQSVNMESMMGFFTNQTEKLMVSFIYQNDPNDPYKNTEYTPDHFQQFKKQGVRARLVNLRDTLAKKLNEYGDPLQLTEELRVLVSKIEGEDAEVEVMEPADAVDKTEFLLDQWAKGEQPIISGLPELDAQLFLSQFIGYWVLAGNSGVGKSALMADIAKVNARRGAGVTVCSLEMSRELLLIRMAMENPKLYGLELNEQTIKNPQKVSDIKYALNEFKRLPIYIIEGVYDIHRLVKISRSMAINRGHKLTLFDYIQLGRTKPTDSDVVRVYTVSRELQGLTKADHASGYPGQVVVALSQYANEATKQSRETYNRTDSDEQTEQLETVVDGARPQANRNGNGQNKPIKIPRPTNSDLAWSGQIKQDADGILHMYPLSDTKQNVVDIELYCGKQRMYRAEWGVRSQFHKLKQQFSTQLSMRHAQAPGHVNEPAKLREVKF